MPLNTDNRIKIEILRLKDVYEMGNWGRHHSLLFKDYNFPRMTERQMREWYQYKAKTKNKKCFGIRNEEDKLIGYLTIREVKRFRRLATLGLVLDPNYMNMGYGTEALQVFLDYFFSSLNMKKMILQVAKFNMRAIRCYEKCGFNITDEFYKVMDIQNIDLQEELSLEEIKDNFKVKWNRKYMGFYKMELSVKDYIKEKNENVHNIVDMWKDFRKKTQYVDNNNINNT